MEAIDRVAVNTLQCPHCFAAGAASVRTATGGSVGFFMCGYNTMHAHRPPACYEHELSRIDDRRTAGLDYLRDRMSQLQDHPGDEVVLNELASVTNVLCGGKPLTSVAP